MQKITPFCGLTIMLKRQLIFTHLFLKIPKLSPYRAMARAAPDQRGR